jgi:uncharacterized protein with ATP-grasp and redox domains
MSKVAALVQTLSYDFPPPKMALQLYTLIARETGVADPYKAKKDYANAKALEIYPQIKAFVSAADDPLLAATEAAIAGNIIDYGASTHFDIDDEMRKLFGGAFVSSHRHEFDYELFKNDIARSKKIMYLLDNAGEIVFDKVLIEQLVLMGKEVTAVVRGGVVINDVTMDDAKFVGLTGVTDVISNGIAAPGTLLDLVDASFVRRFRDADLIISKGQGNFETLESEQAPLYFLLKVKCPHVAEGLGAKMGSIILRKQKGEA